MTKFCCFNFEKITIGDGIGRFLGQKSFKMQDLEGMTIDLINAVHC